MASSIFPLPKPGHGLPMKVVGFCPGHWQIPAEYRTPTRHGHCCGSHRAAPLRQPSLPSASAKRRSCLRVFAFTGAFKGGYPSSSRCFRSCAAGTCSMRTKKLIGLEVSGEKLDASHISSFCGTVFPNIKAPSEEF